MIGTLVSVDLDFLNGEDDPIKALKSLLRYIPEDTPAMITVEHHEFIPKLHQWIEHGIVEIPFNILNVDEHHDYYNNFPPHHPEGDEINCGVWGYRLPLKWYKRFTWAYGKSGGEFGDWAFASEWLKNRGIQFSVREHHNLHRLRSKIVAAVFCVSPDWIWVDMHKYIVDAVETVVHHFGLKKAPTREFGSPVDEISGWKITPRPIKKHNVYNII